MIKERAISTGEGVKQTVTERFLDYFQNSPKICIPSHQLLKIILGNIYYSDTIVNVHLANARRLAKKRGLVGYGPRGIYGYASYIYSEGEDDQTINLLGLYDFSTIKPPLQEELRQLMAKGKIVSEAQIIPRFTRSEAFMLRALTELNGVICTYGLAEMLKEYSPKVKKLEEGVEQIICCLRKKLSLYDTTLKIMTLWRGRGYHLCLVA